jgi:hypothetical protein
MGESRLFETLNRLQRRARTLGGIAAILWCVTTVIIAVLIAGWLDLAFELSPAARLAALAIAAVAGIAALTRTILGEFARSQQQLLARNLDALAATGGQIIAGVELAMMRSESFVSPQPLLSFGLAAMAVERAAALADGVPAAQAVPAKSVTRAAEVTGIAAAVLVVLALLLPGPAAAEWLRFIDPYGDHPPFTSVTLVVEPGEATVRYGDGLDVFVTTEGRLVETLELVLQALDASTADTTGEAVPMFQEPSGRWRASLAEVKVETRYFVRAGRARSPKFAIHVLTVPEIQQVRFQLTPPAYSRLPVYLGEVPKDGLSGLVGTQVEVRVRSNRPLRSATARFFVGDQLQLEEQWLGAQNTTEAVGSFVLDYAGRLQIHVTDVAGQQSREPFSASFTILRDERPFVRLLEPRATSFATPSSRLPIVVSAEDDYGVARLELFRSLNDSRYLALTMPLPSETPRRAYEVMHLPLDQYDLSPGDEIKLFARVEDNDPVGAKGSESSVVTVRIISEEEFARMIRTRDGVNTLLSRYQEAQRRLESLVDEMEQLQKKLASLPADAPLGDEIRAELEKLIERMNGEAEMIKRLGQSPLPYDLDKELAKNLDRLGDQLDDLAKATESLAGMQPLRHGQAAEELERLRKQLIGNKEGLQEQTGPPLEALAALYPLLEDEARFAQLYQRQLDLAERLAALRGRDKQDDPALKVRMRDLESEQQRLQTELVALLEDIDGHAKRLPNRPEFKELRLSAEVFAMLVRQSEAESTMTQASLALAEFAGTTAHDQAVRAATILESFLSKSQSIADQGEACLKSSFEPSLGESIGATIAQLLADAGLGTGEGFGNGAGGGYSARRTSLANIGLYGGLPATSGPQGAGQRNTNQRAAGAERYSAESSTTTGDAEGGLSGSRPAAGGGEASVPLQYRRKVGRYFQRLADELGNGAER